MLYPDYISPPQREMTLTRIEALMGELKANQQSTETKLMAEVTKLQAGVVAVRSDVQVVRSDVQVVRAQTDENERLILKLADLTGEITRVLNVFNTFVLYVKTQTPFLCPDVRESLQAVPVLAVGAMAPHSGDKSMPYPVFNNQGHDLPLASLPSLPYAASVPESKKLTDELYFQYKAGAKEECVKRQTEGRKAKKIFNPDVLVEDVDMSDVQFIRVVFNTKDEVTNILYPTVPFVAGPHNDPLPSGSAHGGTFAPASVVLPSPPLPYPTRASGLPTPGTATRPQAAPNGPAEDIQVIPGNLEVSPGGFQGGHSGTRAMGLSQGDNSFLMKRMEDLMEQVASQKRALDDMHARQNEPRKKHGSVVVQDNIDTILALSGMDEVHQGSSVIYQQTLAPMEKWTGKETEKIRNGSVWIRGAIRQAKRTHIPLLEFLETVVEGPGQAWAEGLSREHNRYVLQQVQKASGDLVVVNNQALHLGEPCSLAAPVTEERILSHFHQQFLHNSINKVEAAKVSLFGGAMTQGLKEPLSDFLLRFKAKVWDAGLVIEDTPAHMISLVYLALQPYLKQHGFNSRKTNSLFKTFALYEEFLTEKEAIVIRIRDFAVPLPTGLPGRVARVYPSYARPHEDSSEPPLEDDYDIVDYDQEEQDFYGHGMVNALGSRPPARPKRTSFTPASATAAPQVTIPGPPGQQAIVVKKNQIAFFLSFAGDSADWPSNGKPFVTALRDQNAPGGRPKIKDQVIQLMHFIRPTVPEATVISVFETAKAHNRDWKWCIFHGSEDHHTHKCPCLLKAFPDRTPAYDRNKIEYKKTLHVLQRQQGSGDDSDE
jgi:hypothetical protein